MTEHPTVSRSASAPGQEDAGTQIPSLAVAGREVSAGRPFETQSQLAKHSHVLVQGFPKGVVILVPSAMLAAKCLTMTKSGVLAAEEMPRKTNAARNSCTWRRCLHAPSRAPDLPGGPVWRQQAAPG